MKYMIGRGAQLCAPTNVIYAIENCYKDAIVPLRILTIWLHIQN
ncbi:hypothetical protein [Scytonema millei]|nr:hypothetical protein [Scytonema millei]